jgi:Cellulase (glycosyl hydrolase family 5)
MRIVTFWFSCILTICLFILLVYSMPISGITGRSQRLPAIGEKIELWHGGTRLRGANTWQKFNDPEECPGTICPTYVEQDIEDLKTWKANFVNISHPGLFSENPNSRNEYEPLTPVRDNLLQLIDWCQKRDLFVVVAFRTGPKRREEIFNKPLPPSPVWSDAQAQKAWVRMWRETAELLKDYPSIVGYDLMVEPDTGGHPEKWRALAKDILTEIRKVDAKTPVLIEMADGGGIDTLSGTNPAEFDPTGKLNVVYCVHQYEPYEYSQQQEGRQYCCKVDPDCTDDPPNEDNYVEFSGDYPKRLKGAYDTIKNWRRGYEGKLGIKIPIAVNEFGVVRWAGKWNKRGRQKGPVPDSHKFIEAQQKLLEELGINYAIWKWDPQACIGDDDFNFRHGQFFETHVDTDNKLAGIIKEFWDHNKITLADARWRRPAQHAPSRRVN